MRKGKTVKRGKRKERIERKMWKGEETTGDKRRKRKERVDDKEREREEKDREE